MPRHPEEVEAPSLCVLCNEDNGEDDSPLECDKCDAPYHLNCLDPPLDAVPDGEWFCPGCEDAPGAPVGKWAPTKKKSKAKSKSATAKRSAIGEGAEGAGMRNNHLSAMSIYQLVLLSGPPAKKNRRQ